MELKWENNDLYKQKRKDNEISWIKKSRKGRPKDEDGKHNVLWRY